MKRATNLSHALRLQHGLTYIEVLIAVFVIVVALVPALEALHTGMLGTEIYQSTSAEHYAATAKMEELLTEQHSALIAAAAAAGVAITAINVRIAMTIRSLTRE